MSRRLPLSLWMLGAIVLLVLVGPMLWPAGQIDPLARNLRPSWLHPLGTDQLGRDTLARVLAGGRATLAVGAVAAGMAVALGATIGLLAGMGRRLDPLLMRLTDIFLALPLLPLLLVLVMLFREALGAALGAQMGMFVLITAAIALTSWMTTARVIRAETRSLRQTDFLRAAHALGGTTGGLIRRHILPNVMAAIIVSASLGMGNAILTESAISFLGLGFAPGTPTWGALLQEGVRYLDSYPERALAPGLMISVTVLAVSYLGDALRQHLDPRARRK